MKRLPALSAAAVLGLSACESINAPVSSSEFDPLSAPGGASRVATVDASANFRPGQFVQTSLDNTGFYRERPRGDADADRLLQSDTKMKVISADSSYVRVELDTGEVGFVPTIMVEVPGAGTSVDAAPSPGEFQVYPPVPTTGADDALPYIDPSVTPSEDPLLDDPLADELPPSNVDPLSTELPPSNINPLPEMNDELPATGDAAAKEETKSTDAEDEAEDDEDDF